VLSFLMFAAALFFLCAGGYLVVLAVVALLSLNAKIILQDPVEETLPPYITGEDLL